MSTQKTIYSSNMWGNKKIVIEETKYCEDSNYPTEVSGIELTVEEAKKVAEYINSFDEETFNSTLVDKDSSSKVIKLW